MIYKEIILSKKQSLLTGSMFLMFSVLCILIRLSMECGNIANDTELRGYLLNNVWILRYLPLVVISFVYDPANTMYDDIDSGFLRFCRTTSLNMKKLIGTKVITLFICELCVYIVYIIYLAVLSAVGGEILSITTVLFAFKMMLFFSDILLMMLFFSTIAESKKTFEAILFTIITLAAVAYTPLLLKQMEKYQGRDDLDVLDVLRVEFIPLEKYVLPILVILLAASILLSFLLGSRFIERRHS